MSRARDNKIHELVVAMDTKLQSIRIAIHWQICEASQKLRELGQCHCIRCKSKNFHPKYWQFSCFHWAAKWLFYALCHFPPCYHCDRDDLMLAPALYSAATEFSVSPVCWWQTWYLEKLSHPCKLTKTLNCDTISHDFECLGWQLAPRYIWDGIEFSNFRSLK